MTENHQLTAGEEYLQAVSGFTGNPAEKDNQIARTLAAQKRFGERWDAAGQAVADRKRELEKAKQ